MTDVHEALELLDAAEQRNRDEARRTAQAAHRPASPEQHQHDAARWLADRLRAASSRWTTFTND
jgi:hypothetical protein